MNNITPNCLEIKPISYQSDLAVQHFANIESLPWAMLLRSPSQSHIDSRFDILVAKPIATITTDGAISLVTIQDQTTTSQENPFDIIKQVQSDCLPHLDYDGELPFIGGALGCFSYDLGRRVERMPELAERDLTTPDMMVGIYNWALVVDHQQQSAFIVGEGVEQQWTWLTSQQSEQVSEFKLSSDWQSNMTKQSYSDKFAQVQKYLRSGDCYQINLAQRFKAQYQGSEWQAYQKLEQVNQGPFSAFIRTDKGAVLSVSPERFLQVKDKQIETKPIKGTRPRSEDPATDQEAARDLANAEKDQAENLMIVDLLRNDVGRVAKPGSVHVPKLFDIESFPAVHHLVSTIRAELDKGYSPADLLRASFPGGSITGAPKIRAMEIIEELEPHRRNMYCGSIGYISRHGRMDTSITIRTLVAEQENMHVWAGGGLVADSQCDAEYQETLDKLSRILPVLRD
ncbi:aminodeoxychorismate synthase component 1 [Vibrio ouci]|uniref:aminodeoxychorismate synthase n=1 Tax=Vibrio ouci TaxID=2499078 RepID=A0A4Y8WKJ5_9VIBR|nr:aminodeoxychorismate synthase component 1 [Vibrio ouci]TFH93442.1 aminodeoxychorismate synthase component 1 [Vibrio ouci]